MEWLMRNAIASVLVPPGFLLLVALYGLILIRRRPRFGKSLIALALVALYALSTQYVAHALLQRLEPLPRDPLADRSGQAIVVLGAGTYFEAPEYGTATVNAQGLVRLRYAAHLHRATRKPILTSGGSPEGAPAGEAVHMKETLDHEFQVPVAWVEDQSRTTFENARLAHKLLSAAGIRTIYLVTHAWHMPRARLAFENAGFEVIPAATGYATRFRVTLLDFLPDARALLDSSMFFHELIGIAWYQLQFAIARWG
ncbi:MAG: hypothetical protein A3G24_09385 [Betaproteobacteria bacterium RIFCSPLOWO2_12_FULL_62_13]|nr:MAG: hypothetical protein A3G24_09385 [Betaproteobacteria bacterium RIFCSPLOWO2_12_FULL_62_13]